MTCQILPPNLAGYHRYCPYTNHPNASGRYNERDLATAQRLVAASGTQGQTITLLQCSNCGLNPSTPYLLAVLRQLGYKPHSQLVSAKLFSDQYNNPHSKWQAVNFSWGEDYPSASGFFLADLSCASSNVSRFCRPRLDAEMTQAAQLQASDPEAAARLWAKVDREVTDQAPWVPYATPRSADFGCHGLSGFETP